MRFVRSWPFALAYIAATVLLVKSAEPSHAGVVFLVMLVLAAILAGV